MPTVVVVIVAMAMAWSGLTPAAAVQPASLTAVGPGLSFPESPRSMVISPDGRRGYVLVSGNLVHVVVVDLPSLTIAATITVPPGSGGGSLIDTSLAMAPDGSRVYVAGVGANGIGAIDTATNVFTPAIAFPSGHTVSVVAISPDGGALFAVTIQGDINQYALPSMALVRKIKLGGDTGAANISFTPDSRTVLIAAARPDSLIRLDVATGTLAKAIPVCEYVEHLLVTPDGKKAYAVCSYGSVTVVDLKTGAATKSIGVDYRLAGAAMTKDGSKLIVTAYGFEPKSLEINTVTDAVATKVTMPGTPVVVAASPTTNQAYVLSYAGSGSRLDAVTITNGTPATGIDRLSGPDRYATAVAVSEANYPNAPTIYVTTGEAFPDALAAAPAAAHERAPLLLTKTNVLPNVVRDEILRLKPTKIVVAGGTGAVSAAVFQQLKSLAPGTIRRAGADRYATARAVVAGAFSTSTFVFLATGTDYPDALSAASVGGQLGAPVLLVPGKSKSLDAASRALFKALKTRNTPIIGGTSVVSRGIENDLAASLLNPERSAGADRFSTNRAANHRYATGNRTYYASGLSYPDALAMAAAAPLQGGVVYLVRTGCIPAGVQRDIAATGAASRITLVGGPGVVGNDVAAGKQC
jgi:putative cell wall-binding protein